MKIETEIYGYKIDKEYLYIWMESKQYLNLIKVLGSERISVRLNWNAQEINYDLDNHNKWENFITLRLKDNKKNRDKYSAILWLTHTVLYTNIEEIKRGNF